MPLDFQNYLNPKTRSVLEERIGDTIDNLITLNIRGWGLTAGMYEGARAKAGGSVTMTAARRLVQAVRKGSFVVIITGYPGSTKSGYAGDYLAETDGPPGAAVLARALDVAFNAKSIIVAEEEMKGAIEATCRAAGLNTYDHLTEDSVHACQVLGFSKDEKTAKEESESLLEKYNPTAVISIERPGTNPKGIYHFGNGHSIDSGVYAQVSTLYQMARSRGVLTIAIGDHGGELGLGHIRDTLVKVVPFGGKCLCPCKAGVADGNESDVVVIAHISNWGGYGIAASLGALVGNPDVLHTGDLESMILRESVRAGLVDGILNKPIPSVDAIPEDFHVKLVEMMRYAISAPWSGYESYKSFKLLSFYKLPNEK
jgi:D-glutamate cyclase